MELSTLWWLLAILLIAVEFRRQHPADVAGHAADAGRMIPPHGWTISTASEASAASVCWWC